MLEIDRDILSDWVKYELKQWKKARIFARVLDIHHSTVCAWRDKGSAKIIDINLEKIAKYKNEPVSDTIEWLDVRGVLGGILDKLQDSPALQQAVFEKLVEMRAGQGLSNQYTFDDKLPTVNLDSINRNMCSPVGRLLISELESSVERGEFQDFQAALARFCEMCAFAYPDRDIPLVLALIDGRCLIAGDDIIGNVALALEDFSGNSRYTLRYLKSIQSETPATEWDEGCERGREIETLA